MLLTALACALLAVLLSAARTLYTLLVDRRRRLPTSQSADGPFDIIVVGAGSAGCALAARLAERGLRTLLIEAGAPDTGPFGSAFFKVPLAALGFQATPHHWSFETESEPELTMRGSHWGVGVGAEASGRPLIQCRGKVIGGSSSLNLCNYVRGHPADFEEWGLKGWSWREMLPCFRRFERFHGAPPPEDALAPAADRGAAPWLDVARVGSPHRLARAFVAAARRWLAARGGDGAATPTHLLEAPSEGAGLHWVTITRGQRCSNAAALRSRGAAKAAAAGNLVVRTGVHVLRVELEDQEGAPPRAVGVACRDDASGGLVRYAAKREVVLCAGAINTPHLLLLSGVGDPAQLQAAGVKLRAAAPGVGRNLQDVSAVGVCRRATVKTLDQELRTPWPYLRYLLLRSGPLASNTLEASAFLSARHLAAPGAEGGGDGRPPPGAAPYYAPSIQLLFQPMLFPFAGWGKFADFVRQLKAGTLPAAVTCHVALLRPASRGSVTLRSAHPAAPPRIAPGYLSDANGADLANLVAGVRAALEILGGDASLGGEAMMPTEAEAASDDALAAYVRANACHFNGSLFGSCRAGAEDDDLAVLDERLRVRAVQGLRVADASALAAPVSGQLNAAVTAVAERAAEIIWEEHGESFTKEAKAKAAQAVEAFLEKTEG